MIVMIKASVYKHKATCDVYCHCCMFQCELVLMFCELWMFCSATTSKCGERSDDSTQTHCNCNAFCFFLRARASSVQTFNSVKDVMAPNNKDRDMNFKIVLRKCINPSHISPLASSPIGAILGTRSLLHRTSSKDVMRRDSVVNFSAI